MLMLQQNPLWPQAFGALHSHFKSWWEQSAGAPPDKNGWTALAGDLKRLGMEKTTRDGLLGWAEFQASQWGKTPLRVRVLHPMEREMLTVEGYDRLLELYRLGLLGGPDLEQVLEQCANLTRLPATPDQIQALVHRVLSENIAAQGFGLSH